MCAIFDKLISRDTFLDENISTVEIEKNGEEWHSLSCISDSTDQSVPVNFDMYNRVSKTVNNVILIKCFKYQYSYRQNSRVV